MNEPQPFDIAAELLMSEAERKRRNEQPAQTLSLGTRLNHAYSLIQDNERDLKAMRELLAKIEKAANPRRSLF